MSRGLKPKSLRALDVRDKSRTYLRNKSNSNGEKQISCGDDNKKDNSN